MSFPFYSPSLIKLKQVRFQISVRQELTPHGSRGKAYDKVCGFQRQRELTTKGLVILRILRILREIKNEDDDEDDDEEDDEDDDEDDNSPFIRSSAHRSPFIRSLKRQSYGEVEGEVAIEIGINNRIMALGVLISRVDGLHAGIQTKKEIVEV